jgi:hypothetical protein
LCPCSSNSGALPGRAALGVDDGGKRRVLDTDPLERVLGERAA